MMAYNTSINQRSFERISELDYHSLQLLPVFHRNRIHYHLYHLQKSTQDCLCLEIPMGLWSNESPLFIQNTIIELFDLGIVVKTMCTRYGLVHLCERDVLPV